VIASVEYLYWLAGGLLFVSSLVIGRDRAHPRRLFAAAFWMDLGLLFIAGDKMPPAAVGAQVLALSVIAAGGGLRKSKPRRLPSSVREASALRIGSKLLIPALAIPVCTLGGTIALGKMKIGGVFLIDPANTNLVSFGIGCIIALGLACWMTRDTVLQSVRQSRELTDAIGWTLVLPQMLAMLAAMFQHTGVGSSAAYLASHYIATDVRWIAVAFYCVGMAVFSMILGGGAAAFPLMAGGIGVPVLVGIYHGSAAEIAALGMLSGYAGVLMTPMAAHFNLIPAALLELPDKYGVIRAQAPTAICILAVNVVLLYFLM